LLCAALEEERRAEEAERQAEERAELAASDEQEREISTHIEAVDTLVSKALVSAGFHRSVRKLDWSFKRGVKP
jgi:hypothetical protein